MTQETITDGNRLIRAFMDHGLLAVKLNYDNDWNYLMDAVEKIEGLGKYQVEIDLFSCYIIEAEDLFTQSAGTGFIVESHEDNKIKAVWIAVVEFIKWYNQNK